MGSPELSPGEPRTRAGSILPEMCCFLHFCLSASLIMFAYAPFLFKIFSEFLHYFSLSALLSSASCFKLSPAGFLLSAPRLFLSRVCRSFLFFYYSSTVFYSERVSKKT